MLEQRRRLQEFPALSILGFPQHCQNIPQAGESCQESALTVGIVYTQKKWMTLIVQEMQKSRKGILETVVFVGALLGLLAMLVWLPTVKV